MKKTIMLLNLLLGLGPLSLQAGELNGVKMPEQMTVEGKSLILNGMGLRKVSKFGIPIKVYVAGLYLEKKSSDSDAILRDDTVKHLVMHFVRPVDRDALLEAFRATYDDQCFLECKNTGDQWHLFSPYVVSVRKDNEINLSFFKDKIIIDSSGPNAKRQEIANAILSRNLLSIFINKNKPPGVEFRQGLLGEKN